MLTIISQVGGVIYLISLTLHPLINRNFTKWYVRTSIKTGAFILIYLFSIVVIVPPVAGRYGRVRLPIVETQNLRPLIALTWILNRNYVRPELRETVIDVAVEMSKRYPGSKIVYLDANFPFWNGFPLAPHLSHNDGKKIDIAFLYRDKQSGLITDQHPSIIGYGVCEEPRPSEFNRPLLCEQKGYWQYSKLKTIIPQTRKKDFEFDAVRMKTLIEYFCKENSVGKIFIEPHLKVRLKVTSDKVRLHGCQAVRHDDHIHVQLK